MQLARSVRRSLEAAKAAQHAHVEAHEYALQHTLARQLSRQHSEAARPLEAKGQDKGQGAGGEGSGGTGSGGEGSGGGGDGAQLLGTDARSAAAPGEPPRGRPRASAAGRRSTLALLTPWKAMEWVQVMRHKRRCS